MLDRDGVIVIAHHVSGSVNSATKRVGLPRDVDGGVTSCWIVKESMRAGAIAVRPGNLKCVIDSPRESVLGARNLNGLSASIGFEKPRPGGDEIKVVDIPAIGICERGENSFL